MWVINLTRRSMSSSGSAAEAVRWWALDREQVWMLGPTARNAAKSAFQAKVRRRILSAAFWEWRRGAATAWLEAILARKVPSSERLAASIVARAIKTGLGAKLFALLPNRPIRRLVTQLYSKYLHGVPAGSRCIMPESMLESQVWYLACGNAKSGPYNGCPGIRIECMVCGRSRWVVACSCPSIEGSSQEAVQARRQFCRLESREWEGRRPSARALQDYQISRGIPVTGLRCGQCLLTGTKCTSTITGEEYLVSTVTTCCEGCEAYGSDSSLSSALEVDVEVESE